MEFKELMGALGEQCGLGELSIDEDGVAAIMADDILLSFVEIPATRQLAMYADVADKPEGDCGRLYETLLEAQYLGGVTEGSTFSISPKGKISVHRVDALWDLDVELLMKIVEGFLNLIDRWREVIRLYRPEESVDETGMPDNFALGANSGFLSV